MKQVPDWDEEYILDLINNQVEENSGLEYKATASLQKKDEQKNEISKDVSSFVNSNGGTIIYGVKEYDDKTKRHLPEKIDGGYNPSEISKEWLEQVINSKISPPIDGIYIKPIPLKKNFPERVIYAVSIPEGITAYQASDRRYYKRYNFQSAPMEDYEIRLVMNRARFPLLVPNFCFKTIKKICRTTSTS